MKFLFPVAGLLVATSAFAADGFTLKSGFDYTSGKYGGSTSTDITAIPLTGTYESGNWLFKASVPQLRVAGSSNVIPGVGSTGGVVSRRVAEGMGDLTTSATYSVFSKAVPNAGLDLTGKVKWGTASASAGLGTGQNDVWLLVDPYRKFGRLTVFGGVGYGMLGSTDALPLKNVTSANLGASWQLSPQGSLGLIADHRTRSLATGYAQRELTAFYSRKLADKLKLQAYAVKGYSNGSPDWGGGVVLARGF